VKLQIQIKKEHEKSSTLSCVRRDGSITFSKLQVGFEIHDIAHYVVEKQFQLKNAFFGLLSQGYQINDFMLPKEKRPNALQPKNLPSEALATEHLVNLLSIDFMQSEREMDVSGTLEQILEEHGLSFPNKAEKEKITSMQKELKLLMFKWNQLPNNETLEMIFELP